MDEILANLQGRESSSGTDDDLLAQTEELSLPKSAEPAPEWEEDRIGPTGSVDTSVDMLTSALSEPMLDDGLGSPMLADPTPEAVEDEDDSDSFDLDI